MNYTIYNNVFGNFLVHGNDSVSKQEGGGGFWDVFLKEHFDKIRPDDIFVEIGAHNGFHSIYVSKKCKKVICFEPQYKNFLNIHANILLNDAWNVEAHNFALYDKEIKMKLGDGQNGVDNKNKNILFVDYNIAGPASLFLEEDQENGYIQAKTFDSFNFSRVDYIDLDAEKCDYKVLLGGVETIKKCRPVINFEVSERCNDKYLDFFKKLNYEVRGLTSSDYLATPLN